MSCLSVEVGSYVRDEYLEGLAISGSWRTLSKPVVPLALILSGGLALIVSRSHKIALQPTADQEQQFRRAAGVARFTWNWALAEWERQYKAGEKPTALGLKKQFNAIKGEQFPWVYESPRDANARPFANLGKAYGRFFNKEARRPRFKRKGKSRESFYVANDKFRVDGRTITLPRIGAVKMRESLRFEGKLTCATVSCTAGRWFVSISVEADLPTIPCENQARTVGVDLGVKRLATLSDGILVEGPRPLRSALKRLRRLSRGLNRKAKGSRNRDQAKLRLARCHARVAGIRSDALHKLTTSLVRTYGWVVIEDLNVKGMGRNRRLSRAIADMGFGQFRRQLEYKQALSESEVIVADRWFPSSRLCTGCNALNEGLTLNDRMFNCDGCGHREDRDLNAARNLERYPGLRGNRYACGHPGSGPSARLAGETRMDEAGILRTREHF